MQIYPWDSSGRGATSKSLYADVPRVGTLSVFYLDTASSGSQGRQPCDVRNEQSFRLNI